MSRTDRAARIDRIIRKGRIIITMKAEKMKVRAVRIIGIIRAVIRMRALTQAAAGILAIMSVLREETADRTIDLRKVRTTRTLCRRVPSRMLRNTEMKKSAGSVRKRINVPKKI